MPIFNIYCDESCHLEHDKQRIMLLGALMCPIEHAKRIGEEIHKLKIKYNFQYEHEIKWTKVSKSSLEFYSELTDYFFSEKSLRFRALIVKNKDKLNHNYFNAGSHDSFYYKMYYYLLDILIQPENQYNIYLDIKDSRSRLKVKELREVLCNRNFDFGRKIIPKIQSIHSDKSNLIQFADFLLGAVSYRNRFENIGSEAKHFCIQKIINKSGSSLRASTPPWEEKFNLFVFSPTEVHFNNV